MLKGRKDSKFSLEDILLLLVHLYSLAGEDQEQTLPAELEDRLKSLLAEIFVDECENLSEKLQEFGNFDYFAIEFLFYFYKSFFN